MSTRSNTVRGFKAALTDPRWYPTTQGLNRWVNRMADRSDLTVRVLKHTSGAPARFVPAEAEIDINEGLIAAIDPTLAGSPEFVVKHRATAGACVHEACHARCSNNIDLAKIARIHGHRHVGVFSMLEEGRCETQTWPHLNGVERLALQSMVLDIVLRDMEDEEGNTVPLDMRAIIRLGGLLFARMNTGIVDISQPLSSRMHDALMGALGTDFAILYDIAVRFSHTTVSWYDGGDAKMHDLVREWMAVEDRLLPKEEGDDKGEKPKPKPKDEEGEDGEDGEPGGEPGEDGEDGEPGDGDGDGEPKQPGDKPGKGKGKGKSDDKGDESGEGGDDKGEGDGEGEEGELPGSDDDGTVGDGSNTLDQNDANGEGSLGDYASSNVDAGTFEDIFNSVREAAEEAESISGSRLRQEVVAIHRATAAAHAERRKKNATAAKRWK